MYSFDREEFKMFGHLFYPWKNGDSNWVVYHLGTNATVTAHEKTKKLALEMAKKKLKQQGKKGLENAIKKHHKIYPWTKP